MTSQAVSALTKASTSTAKYTTTANDSMSKTDFLTLLITQLKNQDPTNPQDSSQFASQLAQFSSLEQLMNLNDSLATLQTSSDASAANALIGKDVLYDGDTLTIDTSGSTPDAINFALSADASATTIKVYNSDGDLVRTIDAGAQNGGTDNVSWDGKNSSGNALASGDYTFTVSAVDSSGAAVTSATLIREEVVGVMLSDSTYYLSTESGTLVTQDAVYEVMNHL